jgi:hypothetical protein
MRSLRNHSALLAATLLVSLAACGGDDDSPKSATCVDSTLASSPVTNNGQNGNMFDVVAKTNIRVKALTVNLAPGQVAIPVEIYHRAGSYAGHEAIAADWTKAGSAVVDAAASGPAAIPISLQIDVAAGATHAFYVTADATGSVDYTDGTAVGNVAAEDANLQILEGTGNAYPFVGMFSPRVYIGVVTYARCSP